MSKFTVLTKENAPEATKPIFENIEKGLGFIPNLYAHIGHSANALSNYLAFQSGQAKGTFSAKEREAVYLAVSQENGCIYCQSAHTALGKMNGYTDEEVLQLRAGTHTDEKLNLLANLAKDIQRTHGKPSEELVNRFFGLGYSQAALIDLVSLVIDINFTNYIHNISQVAVDFPVAPALEEAVA